VIFPLVGLGLGLLPTLLLAGLVGLVLLLLQRPQRRFWRAMLWLHLLLVPVHLFGTLPAFSGWFGSRSAGTRGDERGYAGPRIAADGSWQLQDRSSLKLEAAGAVPVDAAIAAAAAARAVHIPSSDGVLLRAFVVEPLQDQPLCTVVLVHGLFRSALELEAPAAMFRRAGCETVLLELRNHGGSSRFPATFGLRESDDVVAAAKFARARPGREHTPLVVFGVSLGTAAVALALPRIADPAGVVLDAPMDDLLAVAHRLFDFNRPGDGRNFFRLVQPWRSLVLVSLELWSGFRVGSVQPARVLATLPQDLPVLVVGGGDDDRMPEDSVRALFDGLPMPLGVKELWIRPGSGHGQVWHDDPGEYERRLRALLQRLRR